jgi:hypothetical protein
MACTSWQPVRLRLTSALAVLAVLASAPLAQAAAVRCRAECGPGTRAQAPACCALHQQPRPVEQPGRDHDHKDHDGGCCPAACQVCAARPFFVASGDALPSNLPPVRFTAVTHATAIDPLDVAFAIFHPPKA